VGDDVSVAGTVDVSELLASDVLGGVDDICDHSGSEKRGVGR
jgi:hypothetical protein